MPVIHHETIYYVTDNNSVLGAFNSRRDALFYLCEGRIYLNTRWLTLPEAGFYIRSEEI